MPQRAIEAERRRESRTPKREEPWSELLSAASHLGVVTAPKDRSRAERALPRCRLLLGTEDQQSFGGSLHTLEGSVSSFEKWTCYTARFSLKKCLKI